MEAVLTRVERAEADPSDANYLREVLRDLTSDPVIALLSRSLERQAESMEAIPKALASLKDDMHKSLRWNTLVFGLISLILMAGLVGTRIVFDADGQIRVNDSPVAEDLGVSPQE